MTKDNIMKHSDGMFHSLFNEVAREYPEIETDHKIIDIGSALLAERPEIFDVIVTLNLYGDIISDIAAQVAGSVGLGGSANIGTNFGMFEAIHGSAPDIAGKGIANPSGLINGAIMMLVHMGDNKTAELIGNAWLKTLENGYHTGDIFRPDFSYQKVGTMEFADEVIKRLGQKPFDLEPMKFKDGDSRIHIKTKPTPPAEKELLGVDVFIDWSEDDRNPGVLGRKLEALQKSNLKLKMITNRGVKVFPDGFDETFCTDHWRCRYLSENSIKGRPKKGEISHNDILVLLGEIRESGLDFIKTENLYNINGVRAYSLGQGE
jgi:isocitrate dehydrogenase